METEKDKTIKVKRLSSNTDYFNNVFKKTEKIVSVIFYILSETNDSYSAAVHVQAIKDRALKTHELSLNTLRLQPHEVEGGLTDFQYTLVSLDSTLNVAKMSGVITTELHTLLNEQIDSVLRFINNRFLNNIGVSVAELTETLVAKTPRKTVDKQRSSSAPVRQQRVSVPAGDISSDAYLVYSQLTDRAERIKTVLEAKPQATVKDISEVVTDVSEKTIQRELNSLIEKGQVIREGERRWSRYSVKQ